MSALLDALPDDVIVALTLYGEARGEGPEGRIAVANVLRNRAQRHGTTPRVEALKPLQFSCWNPGDDANHRLLMELAQLIASGKLVAPGPLLRECFWIARGLLAGDVVDNTKGATHYLTLERLQSHPPAWAKSQPVIAAIGAHAFLRVA